MKILGHTPEGDLIVQVSKAEWDGLQERVKPKDDTEERRAERRREWEGTEAARFFNSFKGLRGKGQARLSYIYGKFDGTLDNLAQVASGELDPFPQMGESARELLRQAILDYKAAKVIT